MPVDPQVAFLLEQMQQQGVGQPFDQMTLAEVRQFALAFKDLEGEPEPVAKVEDRLIPSPYGELAIGVRIYTPDGERPFPLLVYFHGSGWTIANIDVTDAPCRALANASGAIVVAVEYRLGPEHKFPAPLTDCITATRWVADHAVELGGDPERLGVIGDSAGGNLAAAVTLAARESGAPAIAHQILLYPVTDSSCDTASCRENAEGYMLTLRDMRWFWSNYLRNEQDGLNPLASPLRAHSLAGLPPALIVTAEYDPLRDEGEAYGERLMAAGVPVKISRYDGMIHGFLWMGGVVDRTRHLIDEVAAEVKSAPKARTAVPA
jgi:acetyl esterase